MSAAQVRSMQAPGRPRDHRRARARRERRPSRPRCARRPGSATSGPGPLPDTEIDRAPAGGWPPRWPRSRATRRSSYAEPNGEVHAASVPNDPYFGLQWALSNTGQSVLGTRGTPGDDIGAMYAWAHSTGAERDRRRWSTPGVDSTAPDLQGQLARRRGLHQRPDNHPQDQSVTARTSPASSPPSQNNGIGVSGVRRRPRSCRCACSTRTAQRHRSTTWPRLRLRRSTTASRSSTPASAAPSPSQTLEQAIAAPTRTRCTWSRPATTAPNNDDPSTPFYPCDVPEANVICVGASDQNDQPAEFSNYGADQRRPVRARGQHPLHVSRRPVRTPTTTAPRWPRRWSRARSR